MLIKIKGRVMSKARVNGTSVVLELQSGSIVEVRTGREAVFSNSKLNMAEAVSDLHRPNRTKCNVRLQLTPIRHLGSSLWKSIIAEFFCKPLSQLLGPGWFRVPAYMPHRPPTIPTQFTPQSLLRIKAKSRFVSALLSQSGTIQIRRWQRFATTVFPQRRYQLKNFIQASMAGSGKRWRDTTSRRHLLWLVDPAKKFGTFTVARSRSGWFLARHVRPEWLTLRRLPILRDNAAFPLSKLIADSFLKIPTMICIRKRSKPSAM